MSSPPRTFALEEITNQNVIDAKWFLPFTIHRLKNSSANHNAILNLTLSGIMEIPITVQQLQLTWQPESARLTVPPVQEHIITEWAACGMACAVLPLYVGLHLLQVAQAGDGFDYWVGNNEQEFGLEVSGTMGAELESRHRVKVKQLLQSPHDVSGYVSVTSFRTMESILSFHQRQEVERDE
jgi:hypothetical protein